MGAIALTDEDFAVIEEAERRAAGVSNQTWCPHIPTARQQAFLDLEEFEGLYGGQAGGGKSDALLMDALEYVDVPGYSSIIFRRTYKDLSLPGAIMDRAGEWLRPTAASWSEQAKTWSFPSGATLTFGYLDHLKDRFRYQSAEFQRVYFDELTQFPELAYLYLASRIRRLVGMDIPLGMRSATNPGGIGHEWVKERWGLDDEGVQDEDEARDEESGELRVFVPSTLADNPHLDQVEYKRSLSRLDATTRAQLEHGRWVRDHTGLVLPLTRANMIDAAPDHEDMRRVLCIDMGTSELEETLGITVVGWSPSVPDEAYALHAEKHKGMLIAELAGRSRELEADLGGFDLTLMDEGALGSGFGRELRVRYQLPVVAAEKKNRLGYARLFRDAAKAARQPHRPGVTRLYIVRERCEPLIEEAAALLWHDDGKRMVGACHCYDGGLYAYRATRPWAAQVPDPPPPKPGTREAANEWAKKHKARVAKAQSKKAATPWWKQ